MERVRQGQRIRFRAADVNLTADAVEDFQRRRRGRRAGALTAPVPVGQVEVRNDTGEDLPQGAAVELGDILTDIPDAGDMASLLQGVVVEGLLPSAFGPLAVTAEPIPDGEVGRAVLDGVVAAKVNLESTRHRFADVAVGSPALVSRSRGRFEILSLAPGVTAGTSKWALVRRVADGSVRFPARITGATSIASNRWEYDFEEIDIDALGVPGAVSSGRTGASHGKALNRVEFPNTGAGVEGNGVNRDNLPSTFAMQPAPAGVLVELVGPYPRGDGTARWLFSYENQDDGACPETPAP